MGGHGANRPVKKRKPREQTDKVVKYMGTWEVRRLEEDKLRKIQELTLKYVATTQSLYI